MVDPELTLDKIKKVYRKVSTMQSARGGGFTPTPAALPPCPS